MRAEIVDRVVASVGPTAITASDVQREYRLEAFLAGRDPSNLQSDPATLDEVRGRVVDRVLLEEEAQANGVQLPADDESVLQRLQEAREKLASPQAFADALRAAGISEVDLRVHFFKEQKVLRLIDRRLRPEASVEPAEIEDYYQGTLVPELARQGQQQPPALDEVQDRIREILVQRKINGLLDSWLERLRAARDVKLYGSAQAEDKK